MKSKFLNKFLSAYSIHIIMLLGMFFMQSVGELNAEQKGLRIEAGKTYIRQNIERDSVLIADPVEYGFLLKGIKPGMILGLADMKEMMPENMEMVSNWKLDTIAFNGNKKWQKKWKKWIKKNKIGVDPKNPLGKYDIHNSKEAYLDIKAHITLAAFEEGKYILPPLAVLRQIPGEPADTLIFTPEEVEYKTMPVDTATFQIHDIKGQINYPITVKEVVPYFFGVVLIGVLIALIVFLILRHKKKVEEEKIKDPAHIVALRNLDKFRGDKFWQPEKQKLFYSGITDTLREYMASRYEVDAMEMTTYEIFHSLKKDELTPELYDSLKELFERADLVKFAKYVASQEENATVLPLAVRFVTTTYQTEIDDESEEESSKHMPKVKA